MLNISVWTGNIVYVHRLSIFRYALDDLDRDLPDLCNLLLPMGLPGLNNYPTENFALIPLVFLTHPSDLVALFLSKCPIRRTVWRRQHPNKKRSTRLAWPDIAIITWNESIGQGGFSPKRRKWLILLAHHAALFCLYI